MPFDLPNTGYHNPFHSKPAPLMRYGGASPIAPHGTSAMAGGASSPTPPSPRFTLPTPPPQAPGYFGGGMAMGGGMPPTGGGFEAAQARLLPLAGTAAAPQIGNFFARQGAGMSQPQAPRFTLPELEWNAAAEPMPTGGGGGGGGGGNLGKGFSVLTNLAGSFGGDFSPAWQTGKKLFSGLGKLF